MQESNTGNKFNTKRILIIAIAVIVIIACIAVVSGYMKNNDVNAVVTLDVNPSIEINVNKDEKVLDVIPLNEDAKIVVEDLDFSGDSLDVTINALIGSMLQNGYIDENSNSILVSVVSNDSKAGKMLEQELVEEIYEILARSDMESAVLGQVVESKESINDMAEKYDITLGKAKLIGEIIEQKKEHTFDELASLTINDLNLISETSKINLDNVDTKGRASEASYIGESAALTTALNHVGLSKEDISKCEWDLDWENGKMVYEISFDANAYEYEYDIDATNGKIIRSDKERDDDKKMESDPNYKQAKETANLITPESNGKTADGNISKIASDDSTSKYIGEASAKSIALNRAGVSAESIRGYECELDYEKGISVYEISFENGGYEYDCEINAISGEVIKFKKEREE